MIIFKWKFHRGHQETSVTPAFEPLAKCFRQKLNLHTRTFPCTVCTWTWTCPVLSYILTSGHYSMELKVLFQRRAWRRYPWLTSYCLTASVMQVITLRFHCDEETVRVCITRGLFHHSVSPSAMPVPCSIQLQSEHSGGLKSSVLFGWNCVTKTHSTAGGKTVKQK